MARPSGWLWVKIIRQEPVRSRLSRWENDVLGNEAGLQALEAARPRSTDTLLKRKNKKRLIIDLDSTDERSWLKEWHLWEILTEARHMAAA